MKPIIKPNIQYVHPISSQLLRIMKTAGIEGESECAELERLRRSLNDFGQECFNAGRKYQDKLQSPS